MPTSEQTRRERVAIREWLEAMDQAAEHGSRFPLLDLANGSPAEEFAKDPEGYWKRARAIARRLATFGGVNVARARPPLKPDALKT